MQSNIRRVHACLAVTTSLLHFWQNDRDFLRATAVTEREVERKPRSELAQKFDPGEENTPAPPAGTRTRDLSITSLTL